MIKFKLKKEHKNVHIFLNWKKEHKNVRIFLTDSINVSYKRGAGMQYVFQKLSKRHFSQTFFYLLNKKV